MREGRKGAPPPTLECEHDCRTPPALSPLGFLNLRDSRKPRVVCLSSVQGRIRRSTSIPSDSTAHLYTLHLIQTERRIPRTNDGPGGDGHTRKRVGFPLTGLNHPLIHVTSIDRPTKALGHCSRVFEDTTYIRSGAFLCVLDLLLLLLVLIASSTCVRRNEDGLPRAPGH